MKNMLLAVLLAASAAVNAAEPSEAAANTLKRVVPGTITLKEENGWLYSKNELTHLAKGALANGAVEKCSSAKKNKNPIPAIVKFNDDLKALNIKLILVPVPPKAAFYPCAGLKAGDAMKYLTPFYKELRDKGIEVLDLSEAFRNSDKAVYCKTDAHWSPEGIAAAAGKLAELIPLKGNGEYSVTASQVNIAGDLAKSLNGKKPEQENLTLYTVSGKTLDAESPVLLIGDSHTLVFSTGADMLASNAGIAELLSAKLKMPVDRIGVKGSAATAVRINLYRKAAKNPAWLKNKKYVIYCFSCREFTEAASGWAKIPVLKK